MNIRTAFIIDTAHALPLGLAFLLLPWFVLPIFGVEPASGTVFIAQLFGAAIIGFAAMAWFAKDTRDPPSVRALLVGFLIFDAFGLIITILTVLAGVVNVLGWLVAGLFLALSLMRIYFLFANPPRY